MGDAKYIGLDVHLATISVAVLDSAGKSVMEAILETKAETILHVIRGLRGSLHVTFGRRNLRCVVARTLSVDGNLAPKVNGVDCNSVR
jgi:hypothetical protein